MRGRLDRSALPEVVAKAGALVLLALCPLQPSSAQEAPAFDNPHGDLSVSCDECHTTDGWKPLVEPLVFDHASTGFELDFGHRTVECLSCHTELVFANVGTACADCHLDPHQGELGFACEDCHESSSWDPRVDFELFHDATLFPLTGAHEVIDCIACHSEASPFEFQLTPTECFLCHIDDYQSAELDHVELGFPTSCEDCHRTDAWQPAMIDGGNFDHDLFFPLRGAHEVLDCSDCHIGGFGDTPNECIGCHLADYEGVDDPDHVALGFPTMCENCHSTTTWEGAIEVDHEEFFPLRGVHAVLDCQECHADGFEGTPTDCVDCHLDDYQATNDPNHVEAGFSRMCEDCHNESSWEDATIDHDAFFPLTGAHRPLDCEACHAEGFSGTPTDCVSCHLDDYNATEDPDHRASGFPTMCEDCHSTSNWEDAIFDHDSVFRLTGAHRALDCEECHADGFDGTPRDCAGCHLDDYNATDDPDHQASGFPTMCEECHNTTDWEDADFDHDAVFQLTGAHRALDCEACHAEGFDGTPRDCVGCHLDDYNQTDDPDHDAAGFPTMCEDCHNTSDWDDADFDHDSLFFPIFSGSHAGEWDDCTDCHVDPGNFAVFDCTVCHDQADMDDEHDDVDDYVYSSPACLSCHPDGEE